MTHRQRILGAVFAAALAGIPAAGWVFGPGTKRLALDAATAYSHVPSAKRLEAAYVKWQTTHELNGGDRNVVLRLGWSKAFSKEFTRASGQARLDLIEGSVSVEVDGLSRGPVAGRQPAGTGAQRHARA